MDFPFTTDGCSGGIYRAIFRRDPPWLQCCVNHDQIYWEGGPSLWRRNADLGLYRCVRNVGHPWIAALMWAAVRVGGHPWLPLPWRWGYGWKYPRGYERVRTPCPHCPNPDRDSVFDNWRGCQHKTSESGEDPPCVCDGYGSKRQMARLGLSY